MTVMEVVTLGAESGKAKYMRCLVNGIIVKPLYLKGKRRKCFDRGRLRGEGKLGSLGEGSGHW